ncbi:MAG: DUF3667 domain-containing protein [Flammeovirgaceae bacterium]|nr:DUF3667 domain-containing protein [Flammeovirgaceae bacterium]
MATKYQENTAPNVRNGYTLRELPLRKVGMISGPEFMVFDGMFPRTLRDLTIRPGKVAKSYIDGNRVLYYGPVGYFFLMVTLLALYLGFIDMDFTVMMKETQKAIPIEQKNQKSQEIITQFVSDNIKWVLFLGVPFQAFSARYLFFRKSGYNFMEHIVLPFYASGHLLWSTILLFTYMKFVNTMPSLLVSIISPLFFGFAYLTFMSNQSKVKLFFKGVGIYYGGQLLFILSFTLLAVIAVLGITLINPDLLHQLNR